MMLHTKSASEPENSESRLLYLSSFKFVMQDCWALANLNSKVVTRAIEVILDA